MIFKHWCGCITEDYKDGVKFLKICEQHKKDGKWVWIGLQHPRKEKK